MIYFFIFIFLWVCVLLRIILQNVLALQCNISLAMVMKEIEQYIYYNTLLVHIILYDISYLYTHQSCRSQVYVLWKYNCIINKIHVDDTKFALDHTHIIHKYTIVTLWSVVLWCSVHRVYSATNKSDKYHAMLVMNSQIVDAFTSGMAFTR